MHISIGNQKIQLYPAEALVIGSGAAGLNCADELSKRGVEVIMASCDYAGGASLNAGSDKQTFYKLSQSADSTEQLAKDLHGGGHMHGDTAFALAANSARTFFKLVELGVPFPHDGWGQYAGYLTDHDQRARATSAGPLTSRFMAQRLGEAVKRRGVRTLRGSLLRLLTDRGRVCGALLYDASARRGSPLTAVVSGAVVLCTGGSADIYQHSVFPVNQVGAMGAALRVGASATNLWSWQYGLASTNFRWNLSGTYQQVLPHYVDQKGDPVLEGWVVGNPDDSVFLKGYQWPFDGRKAQGSTRVDIAVLHAHLAGRKVFLDFKTQDAYGRLAALGAEAAQYLRNSEANQRSPIERLRHMNPDAIELYRAHNIDLNAEKLPIAVCAQHQNGGLSVDRWWRTGVQGLYAAGEVAGCFGAYRPGGSALLETQVGSLRAAQHIAAHGRGMPERLEDEAFHQIEREADFLGECHLDGDDARAMHEHLRAQMSLCAGPVRRVAEMRVLLNWVTERLLCRHSGEPLDCLRLRDALTCAQATLSSMIHQARHMPCPAGHLVIDRPLTPDALPEDMADDRFAASVVETTVDEQGAHSQLRQARPLPEPGDGWFENIWRRFREGTVYDE